jgi:CHAD domain-containing protein
MHLDDSAIDRTPEEGARLVALSLLDECDEAARRLAKGEGGEALHDFRVGLRRLRTTLRAFRPWLEGSVRRRTEKKLKKLARGTNDARDAEVQLAFLAEEESAFGARRRVGLEFLQERLQARRRAGERRGERLTEKYQRLARKLAPRLCRYERYVDTGGGATFGAVLANLISEELAAFRERWAAIAGPADEDTVHAARIAAKRLRYLAEPLRGNRHADARDAVKHLKRLQDMLGELHDSHVFAREVAAALVDATADRGRRLRSAPERAADGARARQDPRDSPRPGVLATVRIIRARRDALYADLERERRAVDAIAEEIQALAAALEARAGGKVQRPTRRAHSRPLHALDVADTSGHRPLH